MAEEVKSRVPDGFSKFTRAERLHFLRSEGLLDEGDYFRLMDDESPGLDLAENLVENVIGYFHMPMGIIPELIIDDVSRTVPMAVEETSIIAAASRTAKWVNRQGELTTELRGRDILGQIEMAHVRNADRVKEIIQENKKALMERANSIVPGLVSRGGGVSDLRVRVLDREDRQDEKIVVLHVHCDPCDAMGANLINQVCEGLRSTIENLTGERVHMCILSNLVDTRLTRARIVLPKIDPSLGEGIAEASYFAQMDPYRAATNNKGVLNGMDAVLLATGNDWRAVEAGAHAFAARTGRYKALTEWRMEDGDLIGEIECPVIVGTVGGVTKLHPAAQMSLKMLGVETAEGLSRIVAAVGLIQNLGALRALSTIGIVEGHMKLHAANLAMAAGARSEEMPGVLQRLQSYLKEKKKISLSEASEILTAYRGGHDKHTTLGSR